MVSVERKKKGQPDCLAAPANSDWKVVRIPRHPSLKTKGAVNGPSY
jgi:hypothetical protein